MKTEETAQARVRAEVLSQFKGLDPIELARRSSRITTRWIGHPVWSDFEWAGKKVAIYRSLPSEVQLEALEPELRRRKAVLCYPRIVDRSQGLMRFVRVDDPSRLESWEPGPYGGLEPRAEFAEVQAEELSLVVVPGVAFGRGGERIGRGKGYYDRFLPLAPRALRLALAFDFQLFPSLQQSPWDQSVHAVVTESEEVLTDRVRDWVENR